MGAMTLATVNAAVRGTGDLSPTHSGTAGRLALLFAGPENGATETNLNISSGGWTELAARGTHTKIFGRILTGGDATPTVDFQVTARHFAQIAEFTGDVPATLTGIVHAEADQFNGTVTVPNVPNLTITVDDCLVIIAGWHNKTAASDGSTYDNVPNFTEIAESRPAGTDIDFVWNYWQQTTATSISGVTRAMTGTTNASAATGISLALLTASGTPPAFTVSPTVTANTSNSYTLGYTANAASTFYVAAVPAGASAPSAAQIKAGTGGGIVAAANEAVTGADTTVISLASVSPLFPKYKLCALLNNAGGDSSIVSLDNEFLDPPAGKQFQVFDVPLSGTAVESLVNASPAIADGDIWVVDTVTSPGGYAITLTDDGDFDVDVEGDTARQDFDHDVYDDSLRAYYGSATIYIGNHVPFIIGDPTEVAIYAFDLNSAIDPIDLTVHADDDDGDVLAVDNIDALPGSLAITDGVLEGTSGVVQDIFHVNHSWTDVAGDSAEAIITYIVGDVVVPNVVGLTEAGGLTAIADAYLLGQVTSRVDDSSDPGTILAQDPAADEEVPPNTQIALTVSDGPGEFTPVKFKIVTQNQRRRRR